MDLPPQQAVGKGPGSVRLYPPTTCSARWSVLAPRSSGAPALAELQNSRACLPVCKMGNTSNSHQEGRGPSSTETKPPGQHHKASLLRERESSVWVRSACRSLRTGQLGWNPAERPRGGRGEHTSVHSTSVQRQLATPPAPGGSKCPGAHLQHRRARAPDFGLGYDGTTRTVPAFRPKQRKKEANGNASRAVRVTRPRTSQFPPTVLSNRCHFRSLGLLVRRLVASWPWPILLHRSPQARGQKPPAKVRGEQP